MHTINRITAVCMAINIGFTSLTSFYNEGIIYNSEIDCFEAPILEEPIEIDIADDSQVIIEPIVDEVFELTDNAIEEEILVVDDETICDISNAEIELLALVTMAEAEAECEEGKRLVIDTILNRVDSERFDNTITDVIYAPNQFTSMWNGRVDRCYVSDDIYQLVIEELQTRSNYEVLYFTADHYGAYGTPMFQIGNHYFSK